MEIIRTCKCGSCLARSCETHPWTQASCVMSVRPVKVSNAPQHQNQGHWGDTQLSPSHVARLVIQSCILGSYEAGLRPLRRKTLMFPP